jgi:hypothetical protein
LAKLQYEYVVKFISQQIKYSTDLFIAFYGASLFSRYFINLASTTDISNLAFSLSNHNPPETEADSMIHWCFKVLCNEFIGSADITIAVLSNLLLFNHSFIVPEGLQVEIYRRASHGNDFQRESALRFLFASGISPDPVLQEIFELTASKVSVEGFRLLVKYAVEIAAQVPAFFAHLLLHISAGYPMDAAKHAFKLIFQLRINGYLSAREAVDGLHFVEDPDLAAGSAHALVSLVFSSEGEDLVDVVEALDGTYDTIAALQDSPDALVATYGVILGEIAAIRGSK